MDPTKCQHLWDAATEGDLALVQLLCQDPSVSLLWHDAQFHRTAFYRACWSGRTEVVRFMLPLQGVDVNVQQKEGATPLNAACGNGHVDVVEMLLADPRVDVNKPRTEGVTPFYMACQNGHVDVVELLLADRRVDVNQSINAGTSPLWTAANWGNLLVIQRMLASEKEIDTQKKANFNGSTPADWARTRAAKVTRSETESEEDFMRRRENCPKIADLLDSYDRNPAAIREQLTRQLGIRESNAGELFALVIFLSDGYLELSPTPLLSDSEQRTQKFFSLAQQLPLDLQMVLCNRVFGLEDSIIKRTYSERGFLKFAKRFLRS